MRMVMERRLLCCWRGAIIEGTDIDDAAGFNTVTAIQTAGTAECSKVNASDQLGVDAGIGVCQKTRSD